MNTELIVFWSWPDDAGENYRYYYLEQKKSNCKCLIYLVKWPVFQSKFERMEMPLMNEKGASDFTDNLGSFQMM